MSGQEDLQRLVGKLEETYSQLKRDGESLDETILRVGEAIEVYRSLREKFRKSTFDVRKLVVQSSGVAEEEPFDWQSLDANTTR